MVSTQALRFEGLQRDSLVGLRCDIDQERQQGTVVYSGIASLSQERAVKPLTVT